MATKPAPKQAEKIEVPDTPRAALLKQAMQITAHDRNSVYGNPEDNFANIAAYWSRYLSDSAKLEIVISPQDVAHLMILMKVARLSTNPLHQDSLVDVAGYAACAADCQVSDMYRKNGYSSAGIGTGYSPAMQGDNCGQANQANRSR